MTGALAAQFAQSGFADLTALIPATQRARISAEVSAALDAHGVRRDLRISATGASPRRYRIVGRDTLAATCPAALAAYRSPALRALVGEIAGADPELLQKANLGAGEMYDQLQRRDLAVKKYEAVIAANSTNTVADIAQKRIRAAYRE